MIIYSYLFIVYYLLLCRWGTIDRSILVAGDGPVGYITSSLSFDNDAGFLVFFNNVTTGAGHTSGHGQQLIVSNQSILWNYPIYGFDDGIVKILSYYLYNNDTFGWDSSATLLYNPASYDLSLSITEINDGTALNVIQGSSRAKYLFSSDTEM